MCLDCGCNMPDQQHGDDRHLVNADMKAAAAASGISVEQAWKNVQKSMASAKPAGDKRQPTMATAKPAGDNRQPTMATTKPAANAGQKNASSTVHVYRPCAGHPERGDLTAG